MVGPTGMSGSDLNKLYILWASRNVPHVILRFANVLGLCTCQREMTDMAGIYGDIVDRWGQFMGILWTGGDNVWGYCGQVGTGCRHLTLPSDRESRDRFVSGSGMQVRGTNWIEHLASGIEDQRTLRRWF